MRNKLLILMASIALVACKNGGRKGCKRATTGSKGRAERRTGTQIRRRACI